MLIVCIVSFLTLIFQYINVQFPDVLNYWKEGSLTAIRSAISALVIAWPVTLLMSIFIGKDLRADVSKQYIWIRKWLLHLMLFAGALTIIIDMIVLMNTFLNGEITTRFTLKVIAVLLVAVTVFGFYLWELKRDPSTPTKITLLFAIGVSAVIVISIVSSFFLIGTPAQQRDVRLDQQRTSDLQTIQYNLIAYWQDKGALPETLAQIEDDLIGYRNPVDPKTSDSYEYALSEDLSFQLCATFVTKSDDALGATQPRMAYTGGYGDGSFDLWSHEVGRVCFERTIDPDRFQVNKPGVGLLE